MSEFKLSISMVDAFKGRSNRQVTIEAADFAAAAIVASAFVSDYADVTGMRVLWFTLSGKTVYSDSVTANTVNDVGLTMSLRKADNELAPLQIPGPELALFNVDGTLDQTDAAITALMTHFIAGDVRISDHEVVTELVAGRLDK